MNQKRERNVLFYKENLDIALFLRAFGSKIGDNHFIEHSKSKPGQEKFKKYDKNKEWVDTYGVHYSNTGQYRIKSWHLNREERSMSIYDLLIKEMNLEGKENSLTIVHRWLKENVPDKIIDDSDTSSDYKKKYIRPNQRKSKFEKEKVIYDLDEKGMAFLLKRGIKKSLLESDEVLKTIKTSPFYHAGSRANQLNTLFVLKGRAGYICYSIRNELEYVDESGKTQIEGFKGFSYEVRDSIYRLGWLNNKSTDQIDEYFFCETGIDLLSYYQMNIDKCQEKNFVGISYEGNMGKEQFGLVADLLKKEEGPKITLGFDNDTAGKNYNLDMLFDERIFPVLREKGIKELSYLQAWKICFGDNKENAKKLQVLLFELEGKLSLNEQQLNQHKIDIEQTFSEYNACLTAGGSDRINYSWTGIESNTFRVVVQKTGSRDFVEQIINKEFHVNSIQIKIPRLKDWNDDLRNKVSNLEIKIANKGIRNVM